MAGDGISKTLSYLRAEQGWGPPSIPFPDPNRFSAVGFLILEPKKSLSRWDRARVRETRMNHKVVLFLLAASLLICVHLADAQQPKKIPLIGYLSVRDPAGESTRSEAIRLALREFGYIEGQNIAIEYRYGEGRRDRYPELAAELVR
jgi:hypothetical protein